MATRRISRLSGPVGIAVSATVAVIVFGAAPHAGATGTDLREVHFGPDDVDATTGLTTWTVPVNICSVEVEAAGGDGGRSWSGNAGRAVAGHGAVITAREAVSPGDVLTVAVGRTASGGDGEYTPTGGVPGGGSAVPDTTLGGGGGGWSGLATGAVPDQSNVLVVAGGGGGSGNAAGANGGDAGEPGATVGSANGGGAGTETGPGAGGLGAANGQDGSALQGGAGANGGGGGGAGYFGGGGGAVYFDDGGGGGGSSYPFAGSPEFLGSTIKSGSDSADGWVTVRFDPTDPADTCETPTATATDAHGAPLTGQDVAPGSAIHLTGADWPEGQVLTVSFESTPVVLGSATVGADGRFTFAGTIPTDAAGGAHQVVLTPAADTLPTFRFAVAIPSLAATGVTGSAPATLAAFASVLLGVVVLIGTGVRRRIRAR
jgi:hypothetical protein